MTTVRWDVLGMGVIAVDDLIYVDHYPEPDTKMQAQEMRRYGGGLAATAMVAAARLGARAAFYAFLGDDELSQFSREQLAQEHVDHTPVIFCPGARPYHSVVIVDTGTGQRTIVYSVDGVRHLTPGDIDPELIKACRLLFVDHHVAEAGLRAMEIAHQNGIPAVADIEHVPDRATAQLLDQVDHLVVGIELGRSVTGENEPERVVQALARAGHTCTVVTAGDQGCWYAARDCAVRHVPAFQVAVVDTTGCGDVFHGAYAASIARGESVDTAVVVATAAAGLKTTRPGGRAGIPGRATVDAFLREHGYES